MIGDKYILQRYDDQYGRWVDHLTFYGLEQLDDVLKSQTINSWRGYRVIQIITEK